MKKSILNLKGTQELSKNEQKSINGGGIPGGFPDTVCTLKNLGTRCQQTFSGQRYFGYCGTIGNNIPTCIFE